MIHRDQVFALATNKLCIQHFLRTLAPLYLRSSLMRVNLPYRLYANTYSQSRPVKVQVHCRRKDDGNARLIGPALYRWQVNRPGFSRIDYAKSASRRCAVQVFRWSVCSSYIRDRNRITHGFLSSMRRMRFVPEE